MLTAIKVPIQNSLCPNLAILKSPNVIKIKQINMMKQAGMPMIFGQTSPSASSDLTRGITPNKPITVKATIPKYAMIRTTLFFCMTRV